MKGDKFIFFILLFLCLLLAIPDEPENVVLPRRNLEAAVKNPSLSDTRELYHALLKDIEKEIARMGEQGYNDHDKAVTCNALRSQSRKIGRDHVQSWWSPILSFFLQIRDSYEYGLKYLFSSITSDIQQIYSDHHLVFPKTFLTIKQFRDCLFFYENRTCPSYNFLVEIRGKSDSDLLKSCTRSNAAVDSFFSPPKVVDKED
eukprot:gene2113-1289_t